MPGPRIVRYPYQAPVEDPYLNGLSLDWVGWNPRVNEWHDIAEVCRLTTGEGPAESALPQAAGDVHDGSDDEGAGAADRG